MGNREDLLHIPGTLIPVRNVPPPVKPPESILLVRPSALGDVCRTVPVLASLRAAFPNTKIDWLVQEGFEPAIDHHPALQTAGSRVLTFPRHELRAWHAPRTWPALLRFLRSLRPTPSTRYGAVIDCQGLLRSSLFSLATRAPSRIGHADARELAPWFYTHRVAPPASPHTVDRMLSLLAPLSMHPTADMRLYASPESVTAAQHLTPPAGSRYALLAPTSRWPGKQWPDDRFASLVNTLVTDPRFSGVVVVGAVNETDQIPQTLAAVRAHATAVNLLGRTNIAELLAATANAAIVIGNDSATIHAAVGFDRPLVALFGPTDPAIVGPYRRLNDTLTPPARPENATHKDARIGQSLMSQISLSQVLDQIPHALSFVPDSPPSPTSSADSLNATPSSSSNTRTAGVSRSSS